MDDAPEFAEIVLLSLCSDLLHAHNPSCLLCTMQSAIPENKLKINRMPTEEPTNLQAHTLHAVTSYDFEYQRSTSI